MSRRSMIPIAVAVLTAVCFLPTLSGSFLNWDDNVNFLDNPAYRGLGVEQLRWAFTSVLFGHYIPLTRMSWSLNYVLGGMEPWGYHLANVLLHGINATTFYFVARRLLAAVGGTGGQQGRREPALCAAATVAALVFGVHPLRVEPVAWISGRADLLCATFALLAVWAYLRAVEGEGRARPGPVVLSAAAFAGRRSPAPGGADPPGCLSAPSPVPAGVAVAAEREDPDAAGDARGRDRHRSGGSRGSGPHPDFGVRRGRADLGAGVQLPRLGRSIHLAGRAISAL
jgi:hypothetical protein